MRKKTNIIIMGVMVILTLALVLTGCGKKEPHEETYDRMTDQVWIATHSDGHGYIIEFWPDGVCYIIRTYGENWTGAAKRNYTIAEDTRQPVIGTGEFIVALSNDEQTMNVIMPDGESWDFHLSDHARSGIDKDLKSYEEIFKGMNGPQDNGGGNTTQPGNTTPATDPTTNPNVQPNANGKYEYTINQGNFTFETDINVWDYIDSDNNFDLVRMLTDWGFDSIDISLQKEMGLAESTERNMTFLFNLDDSYNLNSYQLRPAVYWMLGNRSRTVHIGPNYGAEAMYTVKGYSPWGMSLDEIELFAYFVQYGTSNKSDPNYPGDGFFPGQKTNDYWLP